MKKIINKINEYFKMKIMKKLLLFQELIYISSTTRKEIIWQHHDNALAKHFEINKTMKLISQNYYFLLIKQKMKNRNKQCCEQIKINN